MLLTNQEIKRIFIAIQKKGVKYIDVQHEIVDHIASDIELSKERFPIWNFEQHLETALSGFPKDFKKLIRSKEKSMNRFWQRKTLDYIKLYFQFPVILFTVLLYMSIVMGTIIYGKLVLGSSLVIMLLLIIFTIYKTYTNAYYSSEKEKKYLVLKMFFGQTTTMILLPTSLLNILQVFKPEESSLFTQHWAIYIASGVVVFTLIWCHACLTAFPKMLHRELQSKYPYLTLAN